MSSKTFYGAIFTGIIFLVISLFIFTAGKCSAEVCDHSTNLIESSRSILSQPLIIDDHLVYPFDYNNKTDIIKLFTEHPNFITAFGEYVGSHSGKYYISLSETENSYFVTFMYDGFAETYIAGK